MRVAAVLGILALLTCGSAGAKTAEPSYTSSVTPAEVDTTLYFHLLNAQDMPINTQRPQEASFQGGQGYGLGANTVRCLHPYTGNIGGTSLGTGGTTSQEFHTYYAYSSPSFVEYDYASDNGDPRVHSVRGLGYDIPLNGSTPVTLHWFMVEHTSEGEDTGAATPNVRVEARIQASDSISVDDKGYGEGEVILQGTTAPVTASGGRILGDGAGQVQASEVDGRWVYDFAVPLLAARDAMPSTTGFVARIDVLIDNSLCAGDDTLMTGTLAPFSDTEHLPRVELRNGLPLQVDHAVAFQVNETLHLQWQVNSGWGNYDVAVEDAHLEVFGPAQVTPLEAFTIQRYREYYHHTEPVEQGWTLQADAMPAGRYTAVFQVPNLQHTALAEARVVFYMQDGLLRDEPPQEAPAAPLLLALAAVALAFALRRAQRP